MSATFLMTSPKAKITLSFEDLHTPQVEERLRQQSALASAIANSQRAAVTPSRLPMGESRRGSIWRNTFVNLAIFGFLGGLLAWGAGEIIQRYNPNLQQQAKDLEQNILDLRYFHQAGRIHNDKRFEEDVAFLKRQGENNPWFALIFNDKLSDAEKTIRRTELQRHDEVREGLAMVCFFAACGMMIAVALGMAESVASRNARGAIIYGGTGAVLGLVGGIFAAVLVSPLYHKLGGGRSIGKGSSGVEVIAQTLSWGVLGLFLSAAPGLVLRNKRKLVFGLIGGVIGGALGGALFAPVGEFTHHNDVLSRLIAIVSIGVVTGLTTALVENVAKQGWLKVAQGLISGKQFIVYRNPTFIGSSPACEIYLFKDFKVGPRHAALHIVPGGGYVIEDLGTGSRTYLNGRPVRRARLRNNDRVQIGSTAFTFHERAKKLGY